MDDRYNVFVAIEPGTDFESFMDVVAETQYVDDWKWYDGDDFGMPWNSVIFYQLKVPGQKDASLIARSIYVTARLGIRKGKLYQVSVGGSNADIRDFVKRCAA